MKREKAQPLPAASDDQEPAGSELLGKDGAVTSPEQREKGGKVCPENHKISPEMVRENGELPAAYNEPSVLLLPVEPSLIHVYWEFSFRHQPAGGPAAARLKLAVESDKGKQTRPVLRFYEVTGIAFDGSNATEFFDVEIDLAARSQYVCLRRPEGSYLAELGFRAGSGRFFPAVRSNTIEVPRAGPVPAQEEEPRIIAARTKEGITPSPAAMAKAEEQPAEVRKPEHTPEVSKPGAEAGSGHPPAIGEEKNAAGTAFLHLTESSTPGQTGKAGKPDMVRQGPTPGCRPPTALSCDIHSRDRRDTNADLVELGEQGLALGVSSSQ